MKRTVVDGNKEKKPDVEEAGQAATLDNSDEVHEKLSHSGEEKGEVEETEGKKLDA